VRSAISHPCGDQPAQPGPGVQLPVADVLRVAVRSSLETADPGARAVGDRLATPELERARVRAAVSELLAAVGSGGRDGADGPPTIER
jgi:hypothetical protein